MALQVKPQLGFTEAIWLAGSRVFDFKGRSRRSEFWWWMLLVIIAEEIVTSLLTILYLSAAVATIIMFFGLAVTVRRLQDTGRSAMWVYVSYLLGIFNQFYTASSDFVQEVVSMAASGNIVPEEITRLAEENTGELTVLGASGFMFFIASFIVIIFCLIDSKPEVNKYSESPKYYEA